MIKISIITIILSLLFITDCVNRTSLSDKQIQVCKQVITGYVSERSANLSEGYEHQALTENILKTYCYENSDGFSSKHYKVYIIKEMPEFTSIKYDKKNSENKESYGVDRWGKCSKFEFELCAQCYGRVTLEGVEYFEKPKVLKDSYLMIFDHGKPKIALLGFWEFIYEKSGIDSK